MTEFMIRVFHPEDKVAVFRIGADTAFFGKPVEAFMEDRKIFLDAFYAFYTDLEPEHSWVACADDIVVGFLTGCLDTRSRLKKYLQFILPRLISNLLLGRYRLGKRTFRYVLGMLTNRLRGGVPHADLDIYPAHLHINVDSLWRGHGLGRQLMEAYLQQLHDAGVKGVFLETTSLNEAACRLYEKMGFHLLESCLDRFWTKWFGYPVDNRCYGLDLSIAPEKG